jgi:choline transport protein
LTSVCFFVADLVLQLVCLNDLDGSFHREGWHGTLLLWAMLLLCVFINVFISGALPTIEIFVLVLHVLGFFGILVPLIYLSGTHNSAKQVFTTFSNSGKWPTHTLAFLVGLQGNALAFVGTDSVVHVCAPLLGLFCLWLTHADVRRSQKCKHGCSSLHASQPCYQRLVGNGHAVRRAF